MGTGALEHCERNPLSLTEQVLALDGDTSHVILDFDFFPREKHQRMTGVLTAQGWPVSLHHLDVAVEERWRRVPYRNKQQGQSSESRRLSSDCRSKHIP